MLPYVALPLCSERAGGTCQREEAYRLRSVVVTVQRADGQEHFCGTLGTDGVEIYTSGGGAAPWNPSSYGSPARKVPVSLLILEREDGAGLWRPPAAAEAEAESVAAIRYYPLTSSCTSAEGAEDEGRMVVYRGLSVQGVERVLNMASVLGKPYEAKVSMPFFSIRKGADAVSYTHLTLPTKA